MIRLGYCCINTTLGGYKTITKTNFEKLTVQQQNKKLEEIYTYNLNLTKKNVEYCIRHQIGAFRVSSALMPMFDHEDCRFDWENNPIIKRIIFDIKKLATEKSIRLTMHIDQFCVIASNKEDVRKRSVDMYNTHCKLGAMLGCDINTMHINNGSDTAIIQLKKSLNELTETARNMIALENQDNSIWTAEKVFNICCELDIPFIWDSHHHDINRSDFVFDEQTTNKYIQLWKGKTPKIHVSSSLDDAKLVKAHADFIRPMDMAKAMLFTKAIPTLDIFLEAKSKEQAVHEIRKFRKK